MKNEDSFLKVILLSANQQITNECMNNGIILPLFIFRLIRSN